jgi:hypothetical protein
MHHRQARSRLARPHAAPAVSASTRTRQAPPSARRAMRARFLLADSSLIAPVASQVGAPFARLLVFTERACALLAGEFVAGTGASFCNPCPTGSYSDRLGTTTCTACTAGRFLLHARVACEPCQPGSVSGAAATICTVCEAGKIDNSTLHDQGLGFAVLLICFVLNSKQLLRCAECVNCHPGSFAERSVSLCFMFVWTLSTSSCYHQNAGTNELPVVPALYICVSDWLHDLR